jgi:hypothetical protein
MRAEDDARRAPSAIHLATRPRHSRHAALYEYYTIDLRMAACL